MAASSILTPSQSGILGEGGRKVLKTRVHVLGRFLLEPSEGFSEEAARRLMERTTSGRRVRVRTQLTVFSSGLRLGERGIFAAMPIEFIKYSRLSDMVASPRHPSLLVICVRDYDQRCATVVGFKDDVCLRVVIDVIDRHRRALEDDVARMSDLQSVASDLQQSGRKVGGHSIDRGDGNWHLRPAAEPANGAAAAVKSASESALTDEDSNYAVLRRSRVSPMTAETNAEPLPTESAVMAENGDQIFSWKSQKSSTTSEAKPLQIESVLLSDDSDYAIIRRSRAAPASAAAKAKPPPPPQHPQPAPLRAEDGTDHPQSQHRYQKNPHHQSPLRQEQQRHSWTLLHAERNGGVGSSGIPVTVADMNTDIEEVETAAVFETAHGPPTLLNELVRRSLGGVGVDFGAVSGGEDERDSRSGMMAEVPPEFVAHASVKRSPDTPQSVNGARPAE